MLPKIEPIRPKPLPRAFDRPDWIYEIKYDGFRAVAYVEDGICRLVSRKGHVYDRFDPLCEWIGDNLPVSNAILDGEVVCIDAEGKSQFYDLMFRREPTYFYAFDLMRLDSEDLRQLPLTERKERLRTLMPGQPSFVHYVDHLAGQGRALFDHVCAMDLEGIVAKPASSPYVRTVPWHKIKNPDYSQAEGRGELFDAVRRR